MQASVSLIRSTVSKLFGKYLFPTNIVIGVGLASLGDFAKQKVIASKTGKPDIQTDQVLKMGLASIPLSVEMHYWYKKLDQWFPTKTRRHVLTKVLLDELVMAPILTFTLIGFLTILEKHGNLKEFREEFVLRLKHSFGLLYLVDVCFYAPVQTLNFYFLPTKYRVILVYMASVLYFSVASYVLHEFAAYYKKQGQLLGDNDEKKKI